MPDFSGATAFMLGAAFEDLENIEPAAITATVDNDALVRNKRLVVSMFY